MSDNKIKIRKLLDENGVEYRWRDHAKVFSMDECAPIGHELGARHCKNLVLTNRQQTEFYLLLTDDKPFKTAVFSKALGISRVSFLPSDKLPQLLGVEPGEASPLALINDVDDRVRLVIDAELLDWDEVCLHPGDSTASLAIRTDALLKLIKDVFHRGYDIVTL